MPIYEYRCRDCEAEFELLLLAGTEAVCPECSGSELERLLSTPAVKSESTRGKAMRAAKRRDAGQAKDRMQERLRYEKSHDRHG
jgi:putative FmdB family regulatory protein